MAGVRGAGRPGGQGRPRRTIVGMADQHPTSGHEQGNNAAAVTPPRLGDLEPIGSGKVRDLYLAPPVVRGAPRDMVIVATDRISAFDVVMRTQVPGKGELLAKMARRWFAFVAARGIVETHALGWEPEPHWGLSDAEHEAVARRVCVCRRAEVLPVECVVRGYLDGSGWLEYTETGAVCGVELPKGLERGARLPEPIFTPATKARSDAHDENITLAQAGTLAGEDVMRRARELSIAIYTAGAEYARDRGVILADTKFEFGFPLTPNGRVLSRDPEAMILVDEVLTPDSSRYWPAEQWAPGGSQPSYDKQFVREHLQELVDAGGWDKMPEPDGLGPSLPDDVVAGTLSRYRQVYAVLWDESAA